AMQHCFEQGNAQLQTAITSISHDLRTPLTAICGYLELLEKESLSAASRQYLAIIRERAEVMTQLTEELFRYSVVLSVPLAQSLQEVSVNRILEGSIAAMYAVLKRHRITPDITMTDHTVLRTLDPSSLSRVFSNLLNNAVKYSDGDLSITLSEDGTITFSNTAAALSEVEVGRLFDRFYTVENAKNATGLGLSIARALVEQMHGQMDAAYEAGRLVIRMHI
ncbi:MAG: HAMP domain-containing sensor histidine kinase, partial [Dialister invisus]|nr:HAMP domain-containing sensor histidine kinase [Dialister invisus]